MLCVVCVVCVVCVCVSCAFILCTSIFSCASAPPPSRLQAPPRRHHPMRRLLGSSSNAGFLSAALMSFLEGSSPCVAFICALMWERGEPLRSLSVTIASVIVPTTCTPGGEDGGAAFLDGCELKLYIRYYVTYRCLVLLECDCTQLCKYIHIFVKFGPRQYEKRDVS